MIRDDLVTDDDDPEAGLRRGIWAALLFESALGALIGVVVALWLLEVGL